MPLDPDRRRKIAHLAMELWNDFIATRAVKPTDYEVFGFTGMEVSKPGTAAIAFFDFCSQIHPGVKAHGVSLQSLVMVSAGRKGKPVSWLWNHPPDGERIKPLIMIDGDVIRAEKQLPRYAATILCLVLHEVGHLVLHWDKLNRKIKARTPEGAPYLDANPQDEEEAWLFAFSVLAAIAGNTVLHARTNNAHDPFWIHFP